MKGILTSILTVLTFTGLQAQVLTSSPKLLVTLTIDQLRTDYLEAFSSLYGEKGFKRLWKEGMVFRNADYKFSNIDRSSAVATLVTGATPSINGIIASKWMNVSTLRPVESIDDNAYMGYSTDENSSPNNLLASTISDELRIATRRKGLVYAIAPFRDAAVLSAGHAGNGAFWMNVYTGKWCSTTYYPEFPDWIVQYNYRQSISNRINDITWTPLFSMNRYTFLPEWRETPFKYHFADDRNNKYKKFVASPMVNDEVNSLAETVINATGMGKDEVPDILSLTYYAGNYDHRTTQDCAMEMQDTYAHLDRSLASLLDYIEKKIGLQNVLFCINSTGYADSEAADHDFYHIPGGEFHLNRCAALLNMFLMATYGEGQYVETYYDNQIYLNHKLIEKKQLNLNDIQDKASEFLMQFSGVNEAYSSHSLLVGARTPEMERIRNGYKRERSGDLIIEVLPGWTVVNDNRPSENKVMRNAYIATPLIFFGFNTKPTIIDEPVEMARVAPTLCQALRIRAPNGSRLMPITGIR